MSGKGITILLSILCISAFGLIVGAVGYLLGGASSKLESSKKKDFIPKYEIPNGPIRNYVYGERESNLEVYSASELHKMFTKPGWENMVGKRIRVTGFAYPSVEGFGFLTGDHWPVREKNPAPNSTFTYSIGPSILVDFASGRDKTNKIRKFDYFEVVGVCGTRQSNSNNHDGLSLTIKDARIDRHSSMFGHDSTE